MTDLSTVDTTIYIGEIAIHQPVTVLTAYFISALAFYYYWKLKQIKNINTPVLYWARHILFVGIASLVGSCSHAFFAVHKGVAYESFWLPMQCLNLIAVYFAQMAVLNSVLKNSPFKKYWKWSYNIQLLLFLIAVFVFHNFLVVILDAVVGIIPVIILLFMDSKNSKSSLWIASGFSTLALSAFVHISKFSFHIYFNHLDIAHIFIMVNLWMLYVGIKKIPTSSE